MATAPERERLHKMVGSWVGAEEMYPSAWNPHGIKAIGLIRATVELDGLFVFSDYAQEHAGSIKFRGRGVYGWDRRVQRYTMHWFDNMGDGSSVIAQGQWHDDSLTFECVRPWGQARYHYRFESDRYAFRIEHASDSSSWQTWLEATYVRE